MPARSQKSETATIHDQTLARGHGGELHQFAEGETPVLTTAQGGPVADDQNTLRYGARGYLPLLEKAGIALDGGEAAADFLVACRKLRLWAREDRAQA